MSIFDRLDRIASRTVDRVNAISFVFTPMVALPNGRPKPDATRMIVTGKGIFSYLSSEFGIQLGVRKSYREANDLRALQVGRDPQLSVDRSMFDGLDKEARQGDRITFPDNPELPSFDVVDSQRDGLSRMVLMLSQRGAQA